jgi:hypothetical protein
MLKPGKSSNFYTKTPPSENSLCFSTDNTHTPMSENDTPNPENAGTPPVAPIKPKITLTPPTSAAAGKPTIKLPGKGATPSPDDNPATAGELVAKRTPDEAPKIKPASAGAGILNRILAQSKEAPTTSETKPKPVEPAASAPAPVPTAPKPGATSTPAVEPKPAPPAPAASTPPPAAPAAPKAPVKLADAPAAPAPATPKPDLKVTHSPFSPKVKDAVPSDVLPLGADKPAVSDSVAKNEVEFDDGKSDKVNFAGVALDAVAAAVAIAGAILVYLNMNP